MFRAVSQGNVDMTLMLKYHPESGAERDSFKDSPRWVVDRCVIHMRLI